MTAPQKEKIILLRGRGLSYSRIAAVLYISENTVKTFCRRNNLGRDYVSSAASDDKPNPLFCKQCRNKLTQTPGRRQKIFCSYSCRIAWWNAHPEQIIRKAIYTFTCPSCHEEFAAYGNKNRKYCSHDCYINTRFGRADKVGERL